jgi:hypothetical protein
MEFSQYRYTYWEKSKFKIQTVAISGQIFPMVHRLTPVQVSAESEPFQFAQKGCSSSEMLF